MNFELLIHCSVVGKRSCIGEILGRQSTFLFLTSLVQRFDIRPPEGQKSINVKEVSCSYYDSIALRSSSDPPSETNSRLRAELRTNIETLGFSQWHCFALYTS